MQALLSFQGMSATKLRFGNPYVYLAVFTMRFPSCAPMWIVRSCSGFVEYLPTVFVCGPRIACDTLYFLSWEFYSLVFLWWFLGVASEASAPVLYSLENCLSTSRKSHTLSRGTQSPFPRNTIQRRLLYVFCFFFCFRGALDFTAEISNDVSRKRRDTFANFPELTCEEQGERARFYGRFSRPASFSRIEWRHGCCRLNRSRRDETLPSRVVSAADSG